MKTSALHALSIAAAMVFALALPAAAQTWNKLSPGETFRKQLEPESGVSLHIFPAAAKRISTVSIQDENGRDIRLTITPGEIKAKFDTMASQATGVDGKLVNNAGASSTPAPEFVLADGLLNIAIESTEKNDPKNKKVWYPRQPFYVRPDPSSYAAMRSGAYKADAREEMQKRWNQWPAASVRGVQVRLERHLSGLRVWMDDRFLAEIPFEGAASVSAAIPEGTPWRWSESRVIASTENSLQPIPLGGYLHDGLDPKVKITTASAAAETLAKFFPEALKDRAVDIGRAKWLQENLTPLTSREQYGPTYFSRRALDRTPENVILSVPNRDYRSVWLLCAPVPGRKPVVSLRLSHFTDNFGGMAGVGDALADCVLSLEKRGGKWPERCREVGKVQLENGTVAPLLIVEVPLNTGAIPDLVDAEEVRGRRSTFHLDLELTRELQIVRPYNRSIHALLPVGSASGVQLLGLAMEQAPRIRLKPEMTGGAYLPGEKNGWELEISKAPNGFRGKLEWVHRDIHGEVGKDSLPLDLPAQQASLKVPLHWPLGNGWHGFDFRVVDEMGRLVWNRTASLVQLPEDTRKAGLESPFGIWWFRSTHVGEDKISVVGPLLQRAGIRHISPQINFPAPDSAELGKYQLSLSMLPKSLLMNGSPEQMKKRQMQAGVLMEAHPNVSWGMIFHEDSLRQAYRFPPEFIGQEPPALTSEQREEIAKKIEYARETAHYLRERHPGIRLMAGNGALNFAIALMQNGFPKDLVDAWGDETSGQAIRPETPPSITINTLFWLREYARKYGYDVPVSTCYEWGYRSTRPGDLTWLEQAQFYTRDLLLALAYKALHINPALVHDVGNSYYYSRWGAVGLMTRYPLMEPKPSFAAYATLTRALDQAKFERVFPADSPTTCVMEFRHGNQWVYALWLPRGARSAQLRFDKGVAPLLQTDMMGKESTLQPESDTVSVELSGSPIYLRASQPLADIHSGPTRLDTPAGQWSVAANFRNPEEWTLSTQPDTAFETSQFDCPRKLATFSLSAAKDPEKGDVSRLALKPDPQLPWPIIRYAILQPKKPVTIPGTPEAIGIQVRGNSSWGRIFFQLKDAKGRTVVSTGQPEDGWALNDWEGRHFVDFDGWNTLRVQLPGWYDNGYPKPQNGDWRFSEETTRLAYPLKLTGIIVEMREKVVRVDEVVNVPNLSIDLANLSVEK